MPSRERICFETHSLSSDIIPDYALSFQLFSAFSLVEVLKQKGTIMSVSMRDLDPAFQGAGQKAYPHFRSCRSRRFIEMIFFSLCCNDSLKACFFEPPL